MNLHIALSASTAHVLHDALIAGGLLFLIALVIVGVYTWYRITKSGVRDGWFTP